MKSGGKLKEISSFKVEDLTKIISKSMFLASSATKDSLTLYLAKKLVDNSDVNIIAVTHRNVMVNYNCHVATNVSTQEEADKLMILYAIHIVASGGTVHIYTQDTDVLFFGSP